MVFGLCNRHDYATVSEETFLLQSTLMDLNTWFNDALKTNMLHCKWNSIQIINIVSFIELADTTLQGRIVNVSVGRDSVGSFSIRGALHSADGDIAIYSSRDIVKTCIGRKYLDARALRAWQKITRTIWLRQAVSRDARISL